MLSLQLVLGVLVAPAKEKRYRVSRGLCCTHNPGHTGRIQPHPTWDVRGDRPQHKLHRAQTHPQCMAPELWGSQQAGEQQGAQAPQL